MNIRSHVTSAALAAAALLSPRYAAAAAAQFMDYITPTPIVGSLSSTCWGAAQVGHRDQSNGLEDKTLTNWNYWDGGIIKDEQTGVYHMFASRWKQSDGHNGWQNDSHCVHATSNNLIGPYVDQGLCFPNDNGGMCHNVNALKLKAGDASGKQYAITCSGGVSGSGRAYGAASLDGPWTYLGNVQLDANGYSGEYSTADNFREMLRADGQQYECINSRLGIADNVIGPYKDQLANNFTNTVAGSPTVNMEDPFLFYAGGVYHVMFHQWSSGQAFLYTSQDGIHSWKLDPGLAYDPSTNMVRYTDGTVNHWPIMERASVYVENGHAVALTFAVLNVQKADDHGNDGNGSKIIVVPFNGRAYDCDHYNVGCDSAADAGQAADAGGRRDAGADGRDAGMPGTGGGHGGAAGAGATGHGGQGGGSAVGGTAGMAGGAGAMTATGGKGGGTGGAAVSGGTGGLATGSGGATGGIGGHAGLAGGPGTGSSGCSCVIAASSADCGPAALGALLLLGCALAVTRRRDRGSRLRRASPRQTCASAPGRNRDPERSRHRPT